MNVKVIQVMNQLASSCSAIVKTLVQVDDKSVSVFSAGIVGTIASVILKFAHKSDVGREIGLSKHS